MRLGQINKLLSFWVKSGLMDQEHSVRIINFMKERQKQQMARFIKFLFIMGAFWLVIGFFATLRLLDAKILLSICNFIVQLFSPIVTLANWVVSLAKWIAGEHYGYFLTGLVCVLCWGLCHYLARRLQARSSVDMVKLGYFTNNDLRLGTTALTCGYIFASIGFQTFNNLISAINNAGHYYGGRSEIDIPYFSFLAIAFFLYIAYRMKDQIALLFAIGFIGHGIGFFTAYYFACYMIDIQFPVIQALVGVLLLFVGLWHVEKVREDEESHMFLFGRTFQWTGMLFIYMSLWVMSLFGISSGSSWHEPNAFELWVANLLFLAACLAGMFYGAQKEDRLYFNWGITFFIIDTYTLFFSRVWATAGTAFGSLLLGILLVGTGYLLRKILIQKASLAKVNK